MKSCAENQNSAQLFFEEMLKSKIVEGFSSSQDKLAFVRICIFSTYFHYFAILKLKQICGKITAHRKGIVEKAQRR